MSAFDEMTLGEVDLVVQGPLGGKHFGDADVDPFMMAGGCMWVIARRADPTLKWEQFKDRTTMAEIKAFTADMELEAMTANPLPRPPAPQS